MALLFIDSTISISWITFIFISITIAIVYTCAAAQKCSYLNLWWNYRWKLGKDLTTAIDIRCISLFFFGEITKYDCVRIIRAISRARQVTVHYRISSKKHQKYSNITVTCDVAIIVVNYSFFHEYYDHRWFS